MKNIMTGLSILAAVGLIWSTAQASIMTYDNRAVFVSNGTTAAYGYEDFTGSSTYTPGNPWTSPYQPGITYTTTSNLIVGPTAGLGNTTNVFVYKFYSPITANVNNAYNMLALDLGIMTGSGTSTFAPTITLTTNLSSYIFPSLTTVKNLRTGMTFFGFRSTGVGEHFTSFTITGSTIPAMSPAIDNVTLGDYVAPVPEPSTFLLLGAGIGGLALLRRIIYKQ